MQIACSRALLVGGNGGVFQKGEQVVLDPGVAFLQPSAVGVGGLQRQAAADTVLEIALLLIQSGSD